MDLRELHREKKRRERFRLMLIYGTILLISIIAVAGVIVRHYRVTKLEMSMQQVKADASKTAISEVVEMERPELNVQLLTPNEYSRPGKELKKVRGIVIHYTANPGTSAMDNRNYFEGLKDSHATKASSHFIIGLDGEIVQCIPCNEWSYASNDRNKDTISIECCIPDDSGMFTKYTYDSLIELVSWLSFRYDLDADDLLRHYDVTGKNCPKYFVEHESAWEALKEDVILYMEKQVKSYE